MKKGTKRKAERQELHEPASMRKVIEDNMRKGLQSIEVRNYRSAIFYFQECLQIIRSSFDLLEEFSEIFALIADAYLCLGKKKIALFFLYRYTSFNSQEELDNFFLLMKHSINSRKFTQDEMERQYYFRECKKEIDVLSKQIIDKVSEPAMNHVRLAAYYGGCHDNFRAIEHLEQAFKNGFNDWDSIFDEDVFKEVIIRTDFEEVFLKYYDFSGWQNEIE